MARLKHMGAKQLRKDLKQAENRNHCTETLWETSSQRQGLCPAQQAASCWMTQPYCPWRAELTALCSQLWLRARVQKVPTVAHWTGPRLHKLHPRELLVLRDTNMGTHLSTAELTLTHSTTCTQSSKPRRCSLHTELTHTTFLTSTPFCIWVERVHLILLLIGWDFFSPPSEWSFSTTSQPYQGLGRSCFTKADALFYDHNLQVLYNLPALHNHYLRVLSWSFWRQGEKREVKQGRQAAWGMRDVNKEHSP